jgi:hypothetical protein
MAARYPEPVVRDVSGVVAGEREGVLRVEVVVGPGDRSGAAAPGTGYPTGASDGRETALTR